MSVDPSYERVCALAELTDGEPALAEVAGERMCLVRLGDTVHAVQDGCSHGSVSLSEGEVSDCSVECWLHGSRFDLRTGAALTPPATAPLRVYPTTIEGEDVYVSATPVAPTEES